MADKMPFGLKIAILNRAFRKKMDEKASDMGLTSVQLRVLGSVSRLEEAGQTEIHQNDLEKIECVTHPAMTRLIQKLERKGFIKCVTSTFDRRYKKISCTEKSSGIHKIILAQDKEVFDEFCKGLDGNKKAEFANLLDRVLKNVNTDIYIGELSEK